MRYVIIPLGVLFVIIWTIISIVDIIECYKTGERAEFYTYLWIGTVMLGIAALSFEYW